ncbi:MAG: lipoprotein insertase outer membrane protein LolB, partial [Burkholderiaceae bacterium]
GFGLPVRGLPDWIEGRPMPDRIATIAPQDGPIERIEQDGWRISILERSATGTPRRLLMEHAELDGAPAVKLQLVLDAPAAP